MCKSPSKYVLHLQAIARDQIGIFEHGVEVFENEEIGMCEYVGEAFTASLIPIIDACKESCTIARLLTLHIHGEEEAEEFWNECQERMISLADRISEVSRRRYNIEDNGPEFFDDDWPPAPDFTGFD